MARSRSIVTRTDYAAALLVAIGAPQTQGNMDVILAAMYAEQPCGQGAAWNPTDTTEPSPGATDFNSVGVKNYPSFGAGVKATATTLLLPAYSKVVADMRSGAPASKTAADWECSPWGWRCGGGSLTSNLSNGRNAGNCRVPGTGGGGTTVNEIPGVPRSAWYFTTATGRCRQGYVAMVSPYLLGNRPFCIRQRYATAANKAATSSSVNTADAKQGGPCRTQVGPFCFDTVLPVLEIAAGGVLLLVGLVLLAVAMTGVVPTKGPAAVAVRAVGQGRERRRRERSAGVASERRQTEVTHRETERRTTIEQTRANREAERIRERRRAAARRRSSVRRAPAHETTIDTRTPEGRRRAQSVLSQPGAHVRRTGGE